MNVKKLVATGNRRKACKEYSPGRYSPWTHTITKVPGPPDSWSHIAVHYPQYSKDSNSKATVWCAFPNEYTDIVRCTYSYKIQFANNCSKII
ncbi:hypothetical protein NQ318_023474 [Aromia moschata]|uniref:Uncharacterized protein n=1 Tax=Aromia moschata TaxID=1265417 RepID=A0AAV8YM65_9CUCU|nr:hypothetical protein NQ318_023474 [Aromia moschata]